MNRTAEQIIIDVRDTRVCSYREYRIYVLPLVCVFIIPLYVWSRFIKFPIFFSFSSSLSLSLSQPAFCCSSPIVKCGTTYTAYCSALTMTKKNNLTSCGLATICASNRNTNIAKTHRYGYCKVFFRLFLLAITSNSKCVYKYIIIIIFISLFFLLSAVVTVAALLFFSLSYVHVCYALHIG